MFSLFSPFPFLRLCLCWVFGILIVSQKPWNEIELALLGAFLCLILGLIIWTKNKLIFHSCSLSLVCVVAASLRTLEIKNRYQKPPNDVQAIRFQITSTPQIRPKTYAFEGEMIALMTTKGQWNTIRSKCLFYLEKSAIPPQIGDTYLAQVRLQSIRPGAFPFGQNWPEYYAIKGIFSTAYVAALRTKLEKIPPKTSLKALFDSWQHNLLQHLHRVVPGERNKAVAGAMLLGAHEKIDFETKKSYAALGAIHILSVSGTHVGILFLCIQFFFKYLPKKKTRSKICLFILPLALIWLYAGITGFSAPVLRASWMFSVVLFAQTFRFPLNSINMLSFTAFVILIWDPTQLYDAGFQLSFLAVLGILIFQPFLSSIWQPTFKKMIVNYFIKQLISLTSLAVSAQVLTFPLILYYFHQFPHVGIMLLVNPLLVILSSISLVLGMVFLMTAPVFNMFGLSKCYYFLGSMFDYSLTLLHELMLWVDTVFQPTIPFLHWEIWMFFSYFFLLIIGKSWWETRNPTLFKGLSILIIASVLFFQIEKWKAISAPGVAYLGQYRGEPVWLSLEGLKANLVGPSNMCQDPAWIQSNISPLLAHHYIRDTVLVNWDVGKNTSWYWKGKSFYFVSKSHSKFPTKVDFLIIDSKLKKGNLDWLNVQSESRWIWTQSLSAYYLKKIANINPYSGYQVALDTVSAKVY